jgi:hypothetical protein
MGHENQMLQNIMGIVSANITHIIYNLTKAVPNLVVNEYDNGRESAINKELDGSTFPS